MFIQLSIIIVEAIVYLVTSCVWNFMYSVEDMVNTLDDCDILEKAILVLGDLIIVHIQYFMIILNHSALMTYLATCLMH